MSMNPVPVQQPVSQPAPKPSTMNNRGNFIFAIVIIAY